VTQSRGGLVHAKTLTFDVCFSYISESDDSVKSEIGLIPLASQL